MKYIVVVECTDAGGIEIGMAILQMGYRPLFLLKPELYKADIGLFLQNFEFKNINTYSVDEIVNVLEPIRDQIAGIGTLVDSRIAIAAAVAQQMNIPGPDKACIQLKDKSCVANLVKEISLPTLSFSKDIELNRLIINEKFKDTPVVVKQRTGCGAIGIQFLTSQNEKQAFIESIENLSDWLIQEYFEGSLYSMEGWVIDGEINYLGWTSRKKIKNTETEFRFEGYGTIPDAVTMIAKKSISNLFDRSCFKRGWFHIEFLIDSSKERIVMIDANVGRVGGAMLPHVLAQSLSVPPSEIYQHALEIQIFGKTAVSLPLNQKLENIYKCICFGSPEEMVIEEVLLPKYPLETSGLRMVRILGAGDYVSKIGHDDMSWIGFVAGAESDVESYAAQIKLKSGNLVYQAAF